MMNNLRKSQELLFLWICIKDEVSYQMIARKCEYLNLQLGLKIEKHPIRQIFFPLFMSGIIDLYKEKTFKVTPPICIWGNQTNVYTNILNAKPEDKTSFPFIYRSKIRPDYNFIKEYKFCAKSVLQSFPSIDKIVNQFKEVPENDNKSLIFNDTLKKYGVAKKNSLYSNWFLINPSNRIFSIPNWIIEPDALNVAHCFSKTFDNKPIGFYNVEQKILKVSRYHFPIMLYRVILLESLLKCGNPGTIDNMYIFPCINKEIVIELNRILCNSILL